MQASTSTETFSSVKMIPEVLIDPLAIILIYLADRSPPMGVGGYLEKVQIIKRERLYVCEPFMFSVAWCGTATQQKGLTDQGQLCSV